MNNSNDFYLRLEEQLSSSSKWPSRYRFKFILKSDENDILELKMIFNDIKNAQSDNEDLNYSVLSKTFGSLSKPQKEKILQMLRNTTSLEKTG